MQMLEILTEQQRTALNTDMTTKPDLVALRASGDYDGMAALYNTPSVPTAFIVWKRLVSIAAIGLNFVATELATRSTTDSARLQVIAAYLAGGINPSLPDHRAFFDDIFSGAGGAATRAKLLSLWKRSTTRFEQLFATGTGSSAVPGQLGVGSGGVLIEGLISGSELAQVFQSSGFGKQ